MKIKLKKALILTGVSICSLSTLVGFTTVRATVQGGQTFTIREQIKTAPKVTLSDFETIQIGTKQADVHEKFGVPTGTLSGLYGDIYTIDQKRVIIYYEFNSDCGNPVTEVKVTDISVAE